ncbi:probable ATP-dependent RNA helicase DDX20 [Diabrotica virgifera virgifera]|uniref:RNA helicase n=1 Tax=Diabrotica virgifera virgifera TaxID=50390 RepID=A0A6P7EYV1_DIAVI|nr:probable ATP-dependent RNA helicase DDX20 [Diabrotica virgifera virgifera]
MLAHQIENDSRSQDVVVVENVTFDSLLLSGKVAQGLTKNGFKKPSPVQLKSIPLGRCGFDLIVKSKSGTGKTLVFSLIALESLNSTKLKKLEVLILAPTREIAVQSHDFIKQIGCFFEGLKVESFIGGLPLAEDKQKCQNCNIAVGTPGRIKHLILDKTLNVNSVKLFVLDEADKLMESSFRNDINEIYNSLPTKKQIITTSATYPNQLEEFLSKYMLSPTHITAELESPLLLGLKQFVVVTKPYSNVAQQLKAKTDALVDIFNNISFTQCLVFSNFQTKAESLSNILNQKGWPSTYISAAQTQEQRLEAVSVLKEFKCRIMLSTDLTARGIDAANVDLVINFDIPIDSMTYLHRMGRAGRYGSSGVCINLTSQGKELTHLQEILGQIGGNTLTIPKLPKINGSISDLLKIEVPLTDHIASKVKNELDESITKTKMYENKTKQKSPNKDNDDPARSEGVHDDQEAISQNISDDDQEFVMVHIDQEAIPQNIGLTDILQNTQQEIEEVRKQISEMDTESILHSLLNQNLNIEVPSNNSLKTNTNKPFDAQAVLDVLKEGCKPTTTKNDDNYKKTVPKVDAEEELKENLLTKNKALLSTSQILSNSSITEGPFCIEQHLKVVKSQFKNEISELSKNSVSDILKIINTKENPKKSDDKPKQDGTGSFDVPSSSKSSKLPKQKSDDKPKPDSTGCLDVPSSSKTCHEEESESESLFHLGYKHLVLSDNDDWKEVLKKRCDADTSVKSNTPSYRRTSSESDQEVKHKKHGKPRRYSAVHDESSSQSEPMDSQMVWSSNPEENSMLEMEWRRQEVAMRWIPVEEEYYEEANVMEHTDEEMEWRRQEEAMKWVEVKTPRTANHVTPTCVLELRKGSNDAEYGHYSSYMEQLDDKLWQNGLEFNSSESFNDWFSFEWELELQATRNYIEQNIYVSEMNKFQK